MLDCDLGSQLLCLTLECVACIDGVSDPNTGMSVFQSLFSAKGAWRQTFIQAPFCAFCMFSSVLILAPEILSVRCSLSCCIGYCSSVCKVLSTYDVLISRRLAEWRKRLLATSCLSVCPSFRMEQLGSNCTDFHEIWYLSLFYENISRKSSFTKLWQEERILCMKTNVHLW